ncbi:MAG: glutaminyl-peptide cyclotransferase [Bacteroidia bacterium]|nr:glutaminyl-peptide cyclotransferase [Bacteroidia bacterium]NNF30590.1 glutaminyl-peptide cyclotransferase [Flavobacteriaceae bacterium]MBT8275309.1 glutaminyl-peptide cyclotransferase [Bacteroidia bacterium]NNJ81605.1 glutaminyl-peptide cyclotransferase [Flavobacteriaceae bacterium]NNK53067.1 glutaminyl-peptide cyclotransferase [Flavobacteriaceae bacterium]
MSFLKFFIIIILVVSPVACGDNEPSAKKLFALEFDGAKKGHKVTEPFNISVKSRKGNIIDSVAFSIDNRKIPASNGNSVQTIDVSEMNLGIRVVTAKIFSEGLSYELADKVILLASETPKLFTYKIIESYPHDINAYTQGLEFHNDTLYESTGQYKRSSLRKTNYITGEVLQNVSLGDGFFGEGLTILNNKIYQLTWQENTGFIYNLETMENTGTFVYGESQEGWGLCNNSQVIYKSDGTERIWSLNSETLAEEGYIEIYTNTAKIPKVNELEWVEGKIYANIYQKDAIAVVNPDNGAVEGVINLKGLKEKVKQHEKLDVLNGIAYKGEPNILYVTGKNWDSLFKIEIVEK